MRMGFRGRRLLCALAALSCAFDMAQRPGAAQQSRVDCKDPVSTVEINFCLEKELQRADVELNRAFQGALAFIDTHDEMSAAARSEWRTALRSAQRAWIAFRDADCGEPVGYEWYGGTGMGAATFGCSLEKTRARTKDLKERYSPR